MQTDQLVGNLQDQLRKQAALINQLERDIEEARLYLQREEPATDRALVRITRAQRSLAAYRS